MALLGIDRRCWLVAAAAACMCTLGLAEASAKRQADPVQPAAETLPNPQSVSFQEESPEIELCCPQPCITYRHHKKRRSVCCNSCDPPIKTELLVKAPTGCCESCYVKVPVCIPACCTDAPKVCYTSGFLGRCVAEYTYCCGFTIRVSFRHRGDVVVHYYGGY